MNIFGKYLGTIIFGYEWLKAKWMIVVLTIVIIFIIASLWLLHDLTRSGIKPEKLLLVKQKVQTKKIDNEQKVTLDYIDGLPDDTLSPVFIRTFGKGRFSR